ncbi:MFS transporter [Xanthobacter autotrophicus]|uniref:MFS transporter n=1 Tax=Xanthobacter autotrophicus TaxID=280 RepID=UPI0024A66436|nr:MFS transporter [Xanthobacter autotrophicus]MDI4655123.1 MFS transporter [Xanthobacter autotrophicus]
MKIMNNDGGPPADRERTTIGYVSWALMEAGRVPYILLVSIFLFAPYFTEHVVGDPVRGQTLYGFGVMASGLAIGLAAPFIGAIADRGGARKPWIAFGAMLMVPLMASLWFVYPGGPIGVLQALLLLGVLNFLIEYNILFQNAMVTTVAPPNKLGFVSGLTGALGQGSSLILTLLVLVCFTLPGRSNWTFFSEPLFHLSQASFEDIRIVGPLTAVGMAFGVGMLLAFSPDTPRSGITLISAMRSGLVEVKKTLSHLKSYPDVGRLLIARMFVNDALVGALMFYGIYAAGIFGWGPTELAIMLLVMAAGGILGSLLGGRMDDRYGSKFTLSFGVACAMLSVLLAVSIGRQEIFFYSDPELARPVWEGPIFKTWPELTYILISLVLNIFAAMCFISARAFMARLSPPHLVAQFFGLFALSGTATAFLAPMTVGVVTAATQSQRIGYGSLVVLFAIGYALLERISVNPRSPAQVLRPETAG